MKRSIFFKIFSGYFLTIIILSTIIIIFSLKLIRDNYISTLESNLKNIGISLKKQVLKYINEEDYSSLDSYIKNVGNATKTRITVIDTKGEVKADSEKNPHLMENHGDRPEIMEALRGNTGKAIRYSTTLEQEMLYIATPLKKENNSVGVIRSSLFLSDIHTLLNKIKKEIITISLILIVISLLATFILSRSITNPIKEIAKGAKKVASGDFETKIFLNSKDELRELADSFNVMTEKIQALFTDISSRTEMLNTIISSLQQGLIGIDKDGKIILSNNSFKEIVNNPDIDEKLYWEVLRTPLLSDLITKVKENRSSETEELELNGRTFLCNATYVEFNQEIVLLFHDITEIKNLDLMKKDFIMNVSHELRTPLTAIKGFVETLEEEVDNKNKQYLDVIKRHTDRLIHIVNDLLLLSKLEEKQVSLEIEAIDLDELIQNVIKIYTKQLKEKNIDIKINIDKHVPNIKGDSFKVEQLFINLLDNAINYTEKGNISISAKRENNNVVINIEDTGIGISPEDIPRIFERFYVTDKSRSRKLGGTGLGLSIVKHIVMLHNGSVHVESTPGSGTTFTIALPIDFYPSP
jgi:two-component system phosphate regulon sensor histidine kinase PhoR